MAEYATAAYEKAANLTHEALTAAKSITTPTAPIRATFRPLRGPPPLPRSSHTLNVVRNRAYIFGGEIKPREPVDNSVHVIALPSAELQEADYVSVPATPDVKGEPVPEARVGHAAAAVENVIYVFGGRGGADMKALEENGRVWTFNTTTRKWSYLDPTKHSAIPPPRSYHAMTSCEHPLPSKKPTINILDPATPEPDPDDAETPEDAKKSIPEPIPMNAHGTLFVHAGCLSSGDRTADLWAFDISSRTWSEMPAAPGPARGGTALRMVKDRIYRYGGFDGTRELGGAIDYLDIKSSTFHDKLGSGEMALHPSTDGWQMNNFPVGSENHGGMRHRSVAGMVPVSTGQGRSYLLIFGGESSASSAGHAAAGKFFDDMWSFQLRPEGGTAAALRDAMWQFVMRKDTGEAEVQEVDYFDAEGAKVAEDSPKPWGARGWFASDAAQDVGGESGGTIVIWGGVSESNERLGDGWVVHIEGRE
ncbi:MAG: hypothetical protein Q9162_000810 [Coniocarpon cinnabarinum]